MQRVTGNIRNRECCYWKKPSCLWEFCAEITSYNLCGPDAARINENKKCGGYASEKFILGLSERLEEKDFESFGAFMFSFIKKGSDVLNRRMGR